MDRRVSDRTMPPAGRFFQPQWFPLESGGGSEYNGLQTVGRVPPELLQDWLSRLLPYPPCSVSSRPLNVIQPVPIHRDEEQTEPIDYSVRHEPLDLSFRSWASESQASLVPVLLNGHLPYGEGFQDAPSYNPFPERAYTNINGNNHAAEYHHYRNGAEVAYTPYHYDVPAYIYPIIPHQHIHPLQPISAHQFIYPYQPISSHQFIYPYQPVYLHQPIVSNQSTLISAVDRAILPIENLQSESRSSQPANGVLSSSSVSSSTNRHPEKNDDSIPNEQSIPNYVVLEDETTRYEIMESNNRQMETTHTETSNNNQKETTHTKTSSSNQLETTQSEMSSNSHLTSFPVSSEVSGSDSKEDRPITSEDQSAELMERKPSTSSAIVHTDENCFRCPLCNRGFGKLKIMKLHNKRCRDKESGRYKCSVCEKKLVQKSSLTNHMRTHTGVKPYKCPVCSRGFADRSTHTKHLRIHTKEKPFVCPICSRRFNQSGNKIRHMKSKHSPKDA